MGKNGLTLCSIVAIVEDDDSVRAATKGLLRSAGYTVEAFSSAEAFLAARIVEAIGCLVIDIHLPGMDGFELQRRMSAELDGTPIVFVTAHDSERIGLEPCRQERWDSFESRLKLRR